MAHTNQTPEVVSYFNLHTQGIGYLNRIREVPIRRGQPFLACDIAALHGAANAVEYTRFDCKVSGAEAERLIRRCMEAVQAEKKVLLAFRIGDLWIDPFLYEKGERQGQPGASLKGRLLFIEWIKVDGVLEYKAPAKQDANAPATQASNDEPAEESAPADAPETDTAAAADKDVPSAPVTARRGAARESRLA
jgi:hypothetical protein